MCLIAKKILAKKEEQNEKHQKRKDEEQQKIIEEVYMKEKQKKELLEYGWSRSAETTVLPRDEKLKQLKEKLKEFKIERSTIEVPKSRNGQFSKHKSVPEKLNH